MAKRPVVYSSPTCPPCRQVKSFFKKHGIPYKEFNIDKDQKAAQRMVRKSGSMSVPVIEIGSKIIVGFKRAEIEEALRKG